MIAVRSSVLGSVGVVVAIAIGAVAILSLAFRAPDEGARIRSLKAEAVSFKKQAGDGRSAPITELICRTSPDVAARKAKGQIQAAAKLARADLGALSLSRAEPTAGGLIVATPVTFDLVVPATTFPAFLEAMNRSSSGVFLDDVDLTPGPQNSIDARFSGRLLCPGAVG